MPLELTQLPYELDALEPLMSKETLEYHYGKHHQSYVTKLNGLIPSSGFENSSLEEIIKNSSSNPAIYNNAAQIWNHDFFWKCLTPKGSSIPQNVSDALTRFFESPEKFQEQFTATATGLFGSGWVWLAKTDSKLEIQALSNAGNPLTHGHKPILVCDVWEHAYYIDHRNSRPNFLKNFFELINWNFVSEQLG